MTEIEHAIKILKRGCVVAYPTDTAYGFAVDATNPKAVKKLNRLKGRNKPISVIFPSISQAGKIVDISPIAEKLLRNFCPGPLTLVLPIKAKGSHWTYLSSGTGNLGIRFPKHKLSMGLAKGINKAITTTSANVSGMPNTYSVQEIKKQFKTKKHKPDFYLDGGKLKNLPPSTIIQVVGKHVTLLREGPIKYEEIIASLK